MLLKWCSFASLKKKNQRNSPITPSLLGSTQQLFSLVLAPCPGLVKSLWHRLWENSLKLTRGLLLWDKLVLPSPREEWWVEVLRQRGLTLVLLKPFPWAERMQPTPESRIWRIINWIISHTSSTATQTFGNFLLTLLQHISYICTASHSHLKWSESYMWPKTSLHWSSVRGGGHPVVTYSLRL